MSKHKRYSSIQEAYQANDYAAAVRMTRQAAKANPFDCDHCHAAPSTRALAPRTFVCQTCYDIVKR